ncbi:MAG: sulfatase-like hydrolase/transferase [Maribacter sp.]|uniref:sulfatase-like hydrolase/transferase n=1 Tax=Maribacter sp. TaxID=1897614 RepID=UPI003C7252B3
MSKKMPFVILALLFITTMTGQVSERPNFVFILTDDQPYGLLGVEGNEIVQTPSIDKLAKDGIRFTNAYITSAICTPSRVSILLSQYERKHGVNFNSGTSISDEAWRKSYPVLMGEAGYYTGWVGKNHSPIGEGGYESGLMEQSFDYWYAGHGHLTFYPKDRHKIFEDAQSDTQVEIIGEGVHDFLDNESKLKGAQHFLEKRPKDKPFMLSINFNLPHGASTSTMQMRETDDAIYKTLYRDMDIPLAKHYIAKADIKEPKLPADLLKVENRQTGYDYVDTPEAVKERYIRQLQAMTGIDRLIGNLRKTLKSMNLDSNTILIFTSDHGLFMGQFGLGGKALCYEVTTHVPLIIYDPKAPRKAKGTTSDALVQSLDIAPTLLSKAGIRIPDSFQGKDLTALVQGGEVGIRNYVFTENLWSTQFGNPRCEAVQNKEWKYIRYYKNNTFPALKKIETAKKMGIDPGKILYAVHDPDIAVYRDYVESPLEGEEPVYEELFNLKIDPDETTNLISNTQYKKQLETLQEEWSREIKSAKGEGSPKVYRYTTESQYESGRYGTPK